METQKKDLIQVVRFAKQAIPTPYESKETSDDKYVHHGTNNLYPNYLLNLYTKCPSHGAIINTKTTYIIGDGLKFVDGKDVDISVNASDNIKEFVDKIIKDYLIFNRFAVEVVFNVFGEAIEFHHVPVHRLRSNKSKTKFWYREDWTLSRNTIVYDRLSRKNDDGKSKIFYFDGYFPSFSHVYMEPEYNAAIEAIVTDIAIRAFNRNNIENHFSPSNIITFFGGANVSDDQRKEAKRKIEDGYTGENGSKFILDFQDQEGKSAEVKSLSAGDWDKAYIEVAKRTMDDILIGHQVTSPMLFGVKTEGQLGGATELETAYEIFKNNYIRVKRDELESALNRLFSFHQELKGKKVAFGDKSLFNTTLSEAMKEKVMTINEIRRDAGLTALPNGDRLLSEVPHVSGSVPSQPAPVQQDAADEKKNSVAERRKLSEDDYVLIKDLGTHADEFEVLDETALSQQKFGQVEDAVLAYVTNHDVKHLTLDQLKALVEKETGVNLTAGRLNEILNELRDAGLIDKRGGDGGGEVEVKPPQMPNVPDTGQIQVMYKYVERPNVPPAASGSRSFCQKLMDNNRLYRRDEIQQMSAIFGYDVYAYAGGFYHNPDTQQTTPYCRHEWAMLKVRKRV